MSVIEEAHDALVQALAEAVPGCPARKDMDLPTAAKSELLNVVKSGRLPEVLAECMGLAEDQVEVEFVQTYDVEWIVRDADDQALQQRFNDGLAAIAACLPLDLTLQGVAFGLTIGPPNFAAHTLAAAPATRAVVFPVRAALRALTLIS